MMVRSTRSKVRRGLKLEALNSRFSSHLIFIKRQTHGKQIDMSASFESDPSPAPGPRIRHEDDTSVYKDDNDAADEDEDDSLDGLDSEGEHPAKHRRSSTLERKLSRADLTFRPVAHN
jgi:hypothetical protein